nr:GPP34 family phosphoprotein [Corynebacterium freiburgense]
MCAVNAKGKLPSTHTNPWLCFVFSALMDMHLAECVDFDESKKSQITITAPLPEKLRHLTPAYNDIAEKAPIRITKLIEQYTLGLSATQRTNLFESIGNSLVRANVATTETSGFLRKTDGFVPAPNAVEYIINKIRTQLSTGNSAEQADEETVVMAALLKNSQLLQSYFAKPERKQIEQALKDFAETQSGSLLKKTVRHIDSLLATIFLASATAAGSST